MTKHYAVAWFVALRCVVFGGDNLEEMVVEDVVGVVGVVVGDAETSNRYLNSKYLRYHVGS